MKITLVASLIAACLPCAAQQSASVAASTASLAPAAAARSVNDIIQTFTQEKINAMEAYLAANPKADDASEVVLELIGNYGELIASYEQIGDEGRQLALLEKQYAAITKGADGDFGAASANIVKRFFILWKGFNSNLDDIKKAHAVFEQGRKDFPEHKDDSWLVYQESKLKWPRLGDTVEISFTALDGTKVELAAMIGKVVFVTYWRTSSDNDLADLPMIKAAYDQLHAQGFEVIGICLDEDKTALENFIKKENIPWPQAFDGKGLDSPLATKNGINISHFNLLIGKDGKMAARQVHGDELQAKVSALLK